MTWEKRWHPLREEWVVVSTHRQDRPWRGETVDASAAPAVPRHDPDCPFCPGNDRAGGQRNPDYRGVFAFDNDHPSVSPAAPTEVVDPGGVLRAAPAGGTCRVVCYHPRHDLGLSRLAVDEADALLAALADETRELGARPEVASVLAVENRGEVVGVSNPHPHGQIYAPDFVFSLIEREARVCARHHGETGRSLLRDVIDAERADGRRLVLERGSALAFLPYFARYAYETYVAPVETHADLTTLSSEERRDLAAALRDTLVRLDNLWRMPFPYVMAIHQAPTDGRAHPGFHAHVELHPPLRKPNLLKYLAGPEIGGGNFLSDTAPEEKAAELRGLGDAHYAASG